MSIIERLASLSNPERIRRKELRMLASQLLSSLTEVVNSWKVEPRVDVDVRNGEISKIYEMVKPGVKTGRTPGPGEEFEKKYWIKLMYKEGTNTPYKGRIEEYVHGSLIESFFNITLKSTPMIAYNSFPHNHESYGKYQGDTRTALAEGKKLIAEAKSLA